MSERIIRTYDREILTTREALKIASTVIIVVDDLIVITLYASDDNLDCWTREVDAALKKRRDANDIFSAKPVLIERAAA